MTKQHSIKNNVLSLLTKIKTFIFPIHKNELYKFIPMCLLTFIILLNINIVRGARDSLIVTQIGSEILSFIKLWVEMPLGVIMVLFYNKLSNMMNSEKIFRIITSFFIVFFFFFAFVFLPYQDFFHPDAEAVNIYLTKLPNMQWFIIMWSKWSYVLFYVMGELWAIIVYSLMYWQLANKITKVSEASRFYVFFSLFGQINLLFSGKIIAYFTSNNHALMPFVTKNSTDMETIIQSLTMAFTILGVVAIIIQKFIEIRVIKKEELIQTKNPEKLKLNTRESLRLIFSSKYLGLICIMVLGYSATINLVEGLFMCKTRQLFPETADFLGYQGKIMFYTGIFTIICSVCGSTIVRKLGWVWGAITTPAMILTTGSMFFISIYLQKSLTVALPLATVVFVGGAYNILSKGTKYSLFDATKEMAYIPLPPELKIKGKAAVDIMGAKIGKSLGAVIQFLCFTIMPWARHDDIVGLLFIMFCIVSIAWLYAVIALSKDYKKLAKQN